MVPLSQPLLHPLSRVLVFLTTNAQMDQDMIVVSRSGERLIHGINLDLSHLGFVSIDAFPNWQSRNSWQEATRTYIGHSSVAYILDVGTDRSPIGFTRSNLPYVTSP